jgi:hypothetical protein
VRPQRLPGQVVSVGEAVERLVDVRAGVRDELDLADLDSVPGAYRARLSSRERSSHMIGPGSPG